MANHDLYPKLIGELKLDFLFPKPEATTVTAARIAENEQHIFSLKTRSCRISPPLGNTVCGELGGIIGVADINIALVMGQVVNAIGHGSPHGIAGKIVRQNAFGLLSSVLSLVQEVAD